MTAEAQQATARTRLRALQAAATGEVVRLLQRLDTKRGSDALEGTREALATAAAVRQQIVSRLAREGGAIVSEGEAAAVAAARDATREVRLEAGEQRPFTFSPQAAAAIEAAVGGVLGEVLAVFSVDAAETIRAAIARGTSTGAPLGDLVAEVSQAIATSFVRAQTAVDTAIQGAYRAADAAIVQEAADALGDELVFFYDGPLAKARPFCREHVGRAYTRAAIDALEADDGQPGPVRVFGGGWNCRHIIAAMLRSTAEEQRIPIIEG